MMWEDARAAILLVVVGVYGFAAAPLAHHASRRGLDLPLAHDEFVRLQALAAGLGWDLSISDVAESAFAVSSFEADLRRAGLAPFRGFFRVTGTGQAWGLFTYPDRFPARLLVFGRPKDGEWHRLYTSLDPEADFAREKFVYRRIRGVYDQNSEKPGATWEPFVSWAAREVFAAYPEIDEVQVMFQRIHTHEPDEADNVVEVGKVHARRTRWRQ